jgi:hypothetical protein
VESSLEFAYPNDSFHKLQKRVLDPCAKFQVDLLSRDFNQKSARKTIFKPTIAIKSLHKNSNQNGEFLSSGM